MTESMRDLLRRGADTVARPELDVAGLVAEAERRVFRRRLASVTASTLAVATITAGGIALRSDADHPTPAPPIPVKTPETPEPTPSAGSATYFAAAPDEAGGPLRGWFATQGKSDIYLSREGEPPRVAIATDKNASCPAVSPDGTRLAYLEGATAVVVPLDGSGDPGAAQVRVDLRKGKGVELPCPQWSPDGQRLAMLGEGPDWTTTELAVVTVTGKRRVLAVLPPYASQFAWSPDGDTVAYLTEDAVWLAPLAAGEPELFWRSTQAPDTERQGKPLPGAPTSLWWLPTGELAVIVLSDHLEDVWPYLPEGPSVLHVIDVGSGRHKKIVLAEIDGAEGFGAGIGRGVWSPDGSRFAVADADGRFVTVHDRGSGSTLTLTPKLDDGRRVSVNGVSWSADGEHLLSDAQSGPDSERGPFAQVSIALDGSVDVLTPWAYVKLPH